MTRVRTSPPAWQVILWWAITWSALAVLIWAVAMTVVSYRSSIAADEAPVTVKSTAKGPVLDVPNAAAKTQKEMKPYTEIISGTRAAFDMVPIPGGKFRMGSPAGEKGRGKDEGPQHEVTIEPFWMAKHEVRWDEYEIWSFKLDVKRREVTGDKATELDASADAVTRPTAPYTDMTFRRGKKGYPAIFMTQLAAKKYCEWLTAKTGRYYRLPTEAEWEYACRAGTTTAYSFGDDPSNLNDYAWSADNSRNKYHKVGEKKPNPWGLYDMHGNVAEWVLDAHDTGKFYESLSGKTTANPFNPPKSEYPRGARGGSWADDPALLRSAARRGSNEDWKIQDPQLPQSQWYFTDAIFVGFRVIRPLREPTEEEKKLYRPDKYEQIQK
jgi:formylglycine-generating enzyme required for sulfatase activity